MIAVEPRITTYEGRRVLVVDRRPPLPASLELLRRQMIVSFELPLRRAGGTASACLADDHRLLRFLEGRHVGTDAVVRDLRLSICQDCEAVEVRDISYDRLDRLPTGGQPPRRRDKIIGWYTGARPRGREFC